MQSLTDRQIKAVQLIVDGAVQSAPKVEGSYRLVKSQSAEGASYVTSSYDCSCPDHTYRGHTCKHMIAVRLQAVLDASGSVDVQAPHTTNGRMPVAEREE